MCSQRGHFNPFVLYPHFLQCLEKDNASKRDDFVVLKIKINVIITPIAIAAQIIIANLHYTPILHIFTLNNFKIYKIKNLIH